MTAAPLNTPWIEKYRPTKLNEIVGNKRIISNLESISQTNEQKNNP